MVETLDVSSMLPNQFQPKTKNRWIFGIEGVDAFLMKTAARPEIVTEELPISYMNATRYIAGKTTFNTMNVTLHDPIAPSGAQQVMEWLRLVYEAVSGRSGYADFYKRDGHIKVVDPVGTICEYWDMKGIFPTNINYGDLSYEDATLAEISLTLRYDLAVLQY